MPPYVPTDEMAAEARRGLDWRREYGRGGTAVGVARARDIANQANLPLDTVRRMNSFFARHEIDKQATGFRPGEDGYPSAGRIAWALWGGDPGQAWARRIIDEEGRMADHDQQPDDDEIRRAFSSRRNTEHVWVRIEERNVDTVDGKPRLSGLASVFDVQARVRLPDGRVVAEEVSRSAFANTLNRSDIFLLWAHDWSQPLARTGAGNLDLAITERGLAFDATLPDTQAGRDAAELVRTGIVNQMSFGFTLPKNGDRIAAQPDGTILRTLTDVRLHEVSLVSRAAYGAATTAAVRSDAFGLLCRSLDIDEEHVLAAVRSGEDLPATIRTSEPGAGTTRDTQRAGTTASVPPSILLARLALDEAAIRAGIPR